MHPIGLPLPRRDSEPKVRGLTRFGADLPVADLLHARLVLSPEAHALIRSLAADAGARRMYEPLAREEVLYAGQPVALVVADSEAAAADAVELVQLELEPLEPVLDLEAAARPGAPRARVRATSAAGEGDLADAHASVAAGGELDEELSENVLGTARLAHGDVDSELARSHVVVSGTFATPWIYQGYLEPQTATAWVQPDGELVVHSATQSPFATRASLARLLGLPVERVRVVATPLGGAFGGKLMLLEPLVAAAALVVGRPVRLTLTRSEDMAATNPAGAERLTLTLGADADGRLSAIRGCILVDRGSTEDYGVESIAAMLSAGPYRWRAHELTALGVATNRVTFGAYRAPAAAPAAFAVESLIDELAERLGIDPIELRLANVAQEGDRALSGQPLTAFGARRCLERLREHPLWTGRHELGPHEGVGVAIGWWPGGYEPAAAACRLDGDGRLTVITGAADMSGVETG